MRKKKYSVYLKIKTYNSTVTWYFELSENDDIKDNI